jgi:hypothetical protein
MAYELLINKLVVNYTHNVESSRGVLQDPGGSSMGERQTAVRAQILAPALCLIPCVKIETQHPSPTGPLMIHSSDLGFLDTH